MNPIVPQFPEWNTDQPDIHQTKVGERIYSWYPGRKLLYVYEDIDENSFTVDCLGLFPDFKPEDLLILLEEIK